MDFPALVRHGDDRRGGPGARSTSWTARRRRSTLLRQSLSTAPAGVTPDIARSVTPVARHGHDDPRLPPRAEARDEPRGGTAPRPAAARGAAGDDRSTASSPTSRPRRSPRRSDLAEPAPPCGRRRARPAPRSPWCSIDNDDSRDLDQLTVAEPLAGGAVRIRVAVADVSAAVAPGSALDGHAGTNTTSVYTPPQNFPMLPERLSTDLTSLGQDEDRLAVVVEMVGGRRRRERPGASVYRAVVRNQAKLAYAGVGAWLEGRGPLPAAAGAVPGWTRTSGSRTGSPSGSRRTATSTGPSSSTPSRSTPASTGTAVSGLAADERNRARDLIEDFMIAANGAIARFLEARRFPVVRRVVRSPERWQRIVDIALEHGRPAAARARREGAERLPAPAPRGGPAALPRPLARGHQAARPRRVRGQLPRPGRHRPLRAGGERVHALDRAQPALPGPRHPAAAPGRAGGTRRSRTPAAPSRRSPRTAR